MVLNKKNDNFNIHSKMANNPYFESSNFLHNR